MLKINNLEVSQYIKNKDIINNPYIISELYQAQCKMSFMKENEETWFHFCEAIYLFATLNSSVNFENYDPLDIFFGLIEFANTKIDVRESEFVLSSVNEFDWSEYVSANSSKLKKALNQLSKINQEAGPIYDFYANPQPVPEALFDELENCKHYLFMAMMFALRCFEKYEDNLPYSIALMEDLFTFCLENSPAKSILKEFQKKLREEIMTTKENT